MAMNAKTQKGSGGGESKFKKETLEPGSYPIRLVSVVTLGLQPQRPFKGEAKPPAPEIMFTYELSDEFMKDEDGNELPDKPRWLSETVPFYSLDSERAKSTQRYYALDPQVEADGDWAELLGNPGVLAVTNNKNKSTGVVYENVAGLTSMTSKAAGKLPELVNPTRCFDIDEPDMEIFLSFPAWIQNKMKDNLEYGGSALEKAIAGHSGKEAPKKEPKEEAKAEPDTDGETNEDGEPW